MRLTKLYIHNYKSFYDTTIEFDKLNIVVGENNSGKSNLIDVLEFINIAINKDIERAIDEKGGYDRIKNYSAVGEKKVIIRVTFEFNKIPMKVLFRNFFVKGIDGFFVLSFSFTKTNSIFSIYTNMNIDKVFSNKNEIENFKFIILNSKTKK
jgi:predicted ATP-dependent endonuclease of OLD family